MFRTVPQCSALRQIERIWIKMKFYIKGDTPFETVIVCLKMYLLTKRCFKDNPNGCRLKGISFYLGESGEKTLDEEMFNHE